MPRSATIEATARRFNDARLALLNELDIPERNEQRYALLVLELRSSIEAYLKALQCDRHETEARIRQ